MTGTAELNELLQCQLMFTRAHNTSLRKEETSKTKRKVGAGENRKARFLTDHPHREQKAAQTQQKHFKEKTTNFFASIARLEGVWKIRSWHPQICIVNKSGDRFHSCRRFTRRRSKEKRKTLMRTQNVCKPQETIHNSEKLLHRETFSQSLWWVALLAFLGKTQQHKKSRTKFISRRRTMGTPQIENIPSRDVVQTGSRIERNPRALNPWSVGSRVDGMEIARGTL